MRKTEAEAEGIEGTSTETALNVAVEAAGGTGEAHSGLRTVNEESGHIVGEEHHARCAHLDGEEAGETAAAEETEQISKEDVENRKIHREKKHTQRRETATERSEQMHKTCIRDQKE